MADRRPPRDRDDDQRPRRRGPPRDDRPRGQGRQPGERPFEPRRDRPFRPRGERNFEPGGDRPFERRGDRPFERRGDRPYEPRGDRPPDRRRDEDRPWRRPPSFPGAGERQRDAAERPERPPGRYQRSGPRESRGWSRDDGPGKRPRQPESGAAPPGRQYGRGPDRRFAPPPDRPLRSTPTQAEPELVGVNEELVAGRHPVQEAFAARREAVRLLVVPERRAALDNLVIHATTLRIPVVEVEGGSLTSIASFDGHQGVALVVRRRPPATLEDIVALARQRGQPPFVLVLDSLEDPQNLGTLMRSAEACGVHGVIYPARRAAPLTPAAIKASAGATEHLLLAPVDDLASSMVDLHTIGLRTVGADQDASLSYTDADLRGPLALIVGSEGFGLSGQLRRRLDLVVRIPMRGRIASLNAAVAGSVLLFAAAAQRPGPAPSEPPASPGPTVTDQAGDESMPAPATPASADADLPGPELLPGDT